jgi:hypothetical protein
MRLSGHEKEELERAGVQRKEYDQGRKKLGLKNMKIHEQMGRYYQVTHTVVQLTV